MMRECHTPGPWEAGEPAWFRGRTDPTTGKTPITAGAHGVVANAFGLANARLIAAAPELLEALEALLDQSARPPNWSLDDDLAKARAAVAKALPQDRTEAP